MDAPLCYQLPLFPPEKRCALCGVCRPLSDYTPDKQAKDGLQSWCKPCRNAYYVAYHKGQRMRPAIPDGMKHCAYCQTLLPLDAFGVNAGKPDGKQSYCKACRPRRYQEREKRAAVPRVPRKRLALMPTEKRCPHCGVRKPSVEFYAVSSRPDGLSGVCRACARVGGSARAHQSWARRRLTAEGKALKARMNHRRRLRVKQVPATLTAAEWARILAQQDHRCLACDRPFSDTLPPTRDHIIPVSKGGGLTADNVVALCQSCNSSKRDRLIDHRARARRTPRALH